jgi:hypothetical protein
MPTNAHITDDPAIIYSDLASVLITNDYRADNERYKQMEQDFIPRTVGTKSNIKINQNFCICGVCTREGNLQYLKFPESLDITLSFDSGTSSINLSTSTLYNKLFFVRYISKYQTLIASGQINSISFAGDFTATMNYFMIELRELVADSSN